MSEPVQTIVFKYGGNAMKDNRTKDGLLRGILAFREQGHRVIIVHGGGPFIREALQAADIPSEFVDGQRKTSAEAMEVVDMVLNGKVNGDLVSRINALGYKAIGLSGRDGQITIAEKRQHQTATKDGIQQVDLGYVGSITQVDTSLLDLLLDNQYIPVIACISDDAKGSTFNINGDSFAGQLAGAIAADQFIVLTDVDGLLADVQDPESRLPELALNQIPDLIDRQIISGGMIPKVEACTEAVKGGCQSAWIANGTQPDQLTGLLDGREIGTRIFKN